MTQGVAGGWTHGTITCARRGAGGRPCPCSECRPVLLRWQRLRSARYHDRRRRREAAEHPELYPLSCDFCGTPLQRSSGLALHEYVCDG